MSERKHLRVRLAFEPNRLATEQLIQVYEQIKPMDSRTKAAPSVTNASHDQPSSLRKGGKQ